MSESSVPALALVVMITRNQRQRLVGEEEETTSVPGVKGGREDGHFLHDYKTFACQYSKNTGHVRNKRGSRLVLK